MGGKGSGGHNRRNVEEHIKLGTYRQDMHGDLPESLKALKKSWQQKPCQQNLKM